MTNTTAQAPKYIRISEYVERMIRDRTLVPGQRLPSDKALAEELSTTPVTVGKGLQELVKRGVLVRKVGSGTYVADKWVAPGETRLGRIGVVCHYPIEADFYASDVLNGVRQFWGQKKDDYELLSITRGNCDYVELARDNGLSGLVVVAPQVAFVNRLKGAVDAGLPLVIIGVLFPELESRCFTVDDVAAGREAVRYLVAKGHKDIGIISGHRDTPSSRDRLKGYQQGM